MKGNFIRDINEMIAFVRTLNTVFTPSWQSQYLSAFFHHICAAYYDFGSLYTLRALTVTGDESCF